MQGFFKANGGCGYVKKPDFLLTTGPNGEVFDPKASLPVKKTLKVGIYTSKTVTADLAENPNENGPGLELNLVQFGSR